MKLNYDEFMIHNLINYLTLFGACATKFATPKLKIPAAIY